MTFLTPDSSVLLCQALLAISFAATQLSHCMNSKAVKVQI